MTVSVEDAVAAARLVLANRGDTDTQVTADTPLDELRFDSLDFAEFVIILERKVGKELDPFSVEHLECVRDLAALAVREPA